MWSLVEQRPRVQTKTVLHDTIDSPLCKKEKLFHSSFCYLLAKFSCFCLISGALQKYCIILAPAWGFYARQNPVPFIYWKLRSCLVLHPVGWHETLKVGPFTLWLAKWATVWLLVGRFDMRIFPSRGLGTIQAIGFGTGYQYCYYGCQYCCVQAHRGPWGPWAVWWLQSSELLMNS